jgi:uncharacterized protein DUF11
MEGEGRGLGRRLALLVAVAALGVLGASGVASAASFTVNDTTDAALATPGATSCVSSHGGSCTLRAAVQAADNGGGASTITVPAGTYTITIRPTGGNDPSNGDLDINNNASLTVTGAGAASTTIDANQLDRAFNVQPGASLSLSGVTIENGFAVSAGAGFGGAIESQGALSVDGVTFQDNSGPSSLIESTGGAIEVEQLSSPLTITNSTFVGNSANEGGALTDFATTGLTLDSDKFIDNSAEDGGALLVENDGDGVGAITLNHDEFDHNTSLFGGGAVDTFDGPVSVDGSSFIGNDGGKEGGAMFFEIIGGAPQVSLVNTTITGNRADFGGGLGFLGVVTQASLVNDTIAFNDGPGVEATSLLGSGPAPDGVTNTIIADNRGGDCSNSNGGGSRVPAAVDLGFNLDSDGTCFAAATDKTKVDPLLGQPADNGGPVLTDALATGSPAIDAGTNGGCPPTDARGVKRPQGASCDIGAYEFASAGLSLAAAAPSTATTGVPFNYTLTASSTGPGPSTATTVVDHLPANVTLFGTTSSQGTCTGSGSPVTVTCDLGAITSGSSATATLVVSVSQPGSVTNAVTASNGEGGSASAQASTMVLAPVAPAGASGPRATTGAATGIGAHSATLTGKVTTGGQPTSYFFEYGKAKSLGRVTVVRRIGTDASVSAAVPGLTAASAYHYRLVAVNDSGSSDGAQLTFQSTGRRRPAAIALRVARRTDAALKLAGAVRPPSGMPRRVACSGRLVIALRRGSKTIGSRRVKLSRKCTYSSSFTVAPNAAGKTVKVGARFLGNKVLTPASSRVLTVRLT